MHQPATHPQAQASVDETDLAPGVGPWGDPLPQQHCQQHESHRQSPPATTLTLAGAHSMQGDLHDSAGQKHRPGGSSPLGEYDALADLFLSSDQARSILGQARPAPRASEGGPAPALRLQPAIEPTPGMPATAVPSAPAANPLSAHALILGHLPVLGAAWVGQYAKHLAATSHEPVGLLRVQEGHVCIDLVWPVGSSARAHSRVGPAMMDPSLTTLHAALDAARREASCWLLRVDEVHESELLALDGISGATLLTGADDAAVVSSYRTIKQLSRMVQSRETDEFTLSLAILGAETQRADEAEAKLREAARVYLNTNLGPAAKVGKISPGSTTTMYRAPVEASPVALLHTLLARLASSGSVPAMAPAPALTLTHDAQPVRAATSDALPGPTAHARDVAPRDAGLATLLGFISGDVACPYAPQVQVAWSEDGQVHLLASNEQSGDPTRDLLAAASWVSDHHHLLDRLSPPGVSPKAGAAPTLHVVTRSLPSVRPLLDTAIRVHVLVEVKSPQGMVRAVTPAN